MEIETDLQQHLRRIASPLLAWYHEHSRVLPWREDTDPYRVWVSEIMLQQTRVETVKPYFDRFMQQLPDLQSLAAVSEERLLKLWEGLGYYNRARNLQKAARILVEQHGGVFPSEYDALLALPGIGAYTAGAICSICFGRPTPAVDGNVCRVFARIAEDASDDKKRIFAILQSVYLELHASQRGDFTQSLMELGATVCTPGIPRCDACPLRLLCKAYYHQTQTQFPVKPIKKPRKHECRTVLVLCCGDEVAIRKRPPTGLLPGLWEFPNVSDALTREQIQDTLTSWGICDAVLVGELQHKHIFTHVEWQMIGYRVDCSSQSPAFEWVTRETLSREIALPSAFRPFCALL